VLVADYRCERYESECAVQ